MFKSASNLKTSLLLLLFIAILIISTLVFVSNYFFRPGLELDIKRQVISKLQAYHIINPSVEVEGMDVKLTGMTMNHREAQNIEADIQTISGINQLDSHLTIDTHNRNHKHHYIED